MLERMLERFGDRIERRFERADSRMDDIEARLAQGQHDVSTEVQGMFTELRTTMGETRDEVAKVAKRVGDIERADELADAVAKALEERNVHDATMERGALTERAWKPPSWPMVGLAGGAIGVIGILANFHTGVVIAVAVFKAGWTIIKAAAQLPN
jgi:uncharacterized coiled-coil protein SlyX